MARVHPSWLRLLLPLCCLASAPLAAAATCGAYGPSVVAFYGGNSDGQARDASGHANDLSVVGSVLNPSAGAIEGDRWLGDGFGGTLPAYLSLPLSAWPGAAAGAMECKILFRPITHVQEEIFYVTNAGGTQYLSLFLVVGGNLGVDVTAPTYTNFSGPHGMLSGQVYTVRLEWGPFGVRVRVDGLIVASNASVMSLSATTPMIVGALGATSVRDLSSEVDAVALLTDPVGVVCPLPTATPTVTATSSATATLTATLTGTATWTKTATPSPTPTCTPSATLSGTATASPTATASSTVTASPTASPTVSATATLSSTGTASPTLSATATLSSTGTASPTQSATATQSATETASPSASPTPTVTATISVSVTVVITGTSTPTSTLTETPLLSATSSATATETPAAPPTATSSPTPAYAALKPGGKFYSYPNPFKIDGSSLCTFRFPGSGRAKLELYDIAARRVGELTANQINAAAGVALWDGRLYNNNYAAPGLYLALLRSDAGILTEKLTVIR